MSRVWYVAFREFVATVATRGFFLGLLLTPALIMAAALAVPRVLDQRDFRAEGRIGVVDETGLLMPLLRGALSPERIAAVRTAGARRALERVPESIRGMVENSDAARNPERLITAVIGQVPQLEIEPHADIDTAKAWLMGSLGSRNGNLAVAVIERAAVEPAANGRYGSYELYVPNDLDTRIERTIHQTLRTVIVAARAAAAGLDQRRVDALTRVEGVRTIALTEDGERPTSRAFNRVLPFVFTGLMLLGVMVGGQLLLTSMVEEKSSRVIEVLLSAMSPLELMAGKIIGQMAVTLTVFFVYTSLGMAALVSSAMLGLFDPWLLVYLLVFFVISYLVVGSMMVAVGAAVNEMREAQSLLMPIMLILLVPWLLAIPISLDPNSTFSTVISMVPPVNTFTMMLRLASTSPPPAIQVWMSIAVGVVSVFAAIWFAAKIFQIGLLMNGRPPNLVTLIRWSRAG